MNYKKNMAYFAALAVPAMVVAPIPTEAAMTSSQFITKAKDAIKNMDQPNITSTTIESLLDAYYSAEDETFQEKVDGSLLSLNGPAGSRDIIENLEWVLEYLDYRAEVQAYNRAFLAVNKAKITWYDYEMILMQYDDLGMGQDYIVNAEIMDELLLELQNAAVLNEAAKFKSKLDAITEQNVTERMLEQLQTEFDELPFEVQDIITDIEKLERLAEYLYLKTFKEQAGSVQYMLDSLREKTITLDEIEKVQLAYEALELEAQDQIIGAERLELLYNAALKNAAAPLQERIRKITEATVTYELIESVELEFLGLDAEIQNAVDNYDLLEQFMTYLMNQEKFADEVALAITKLTPTSTKEEVQAVYGRYSKLSIAAKRLIGSEQILYLQDYLEKFGVKVVISRDIAAEQITALIQNIWASPTFVDDFEVAKKIFDAATPEVKAAVKNAEILNNYANLNKAVNKKTDIKHITKAVEANKKWKVTLSNPVLNSAGNLSKISVYDQTGQKVLVDVKVDGNAIIVSAPTNNYTSGMEYVLVIEDTLQSMKNKALKNGTMHYFSVK